MEYLTTSLPLDGTSLRCHSVRTGSGLPPLVLLHPWFGCWQFWEQTVAALPEFECHLVDGYSLGEGEWTRYGGPEGYARAVVALADRFELSSFVLAGNSMGGITAQVVASSVSERVSRLVLIGTGPHTKTVQPDYQARLEAWADAGATVRSEQDWRDTERIVDSIVARRPESDELWHTYVAAVVSANRTFVIDMLKQAWRLDLQDRLPRISAPTLIVRGEHDAARTLLDVERLRGGIADCRYVEIAGAGHSPMADSAPQFIEVLRDFLCRPPLHSSRIARPSSADRSPR